MSLIDWLRTRPTLLIAIVYVAATALMTWPLPAHAGSAVQDRGDPLMQTWVMRNLQHNLVHHPLDLYQGTAYFPFPDSLAYSEEAISTALVAWPIYLVSGNDILAYNLLFMGSFWLVGIAVYLLTRELGAVPGAAFVAGLAAAFAPARFGHLSHLNLLAIGWLPLALWAFTRYVRTRRSRYAASAGVALAMQLLASLHLAVFSTVAVALYLPLLLYVERGRQRVAWTRSGWIGLGLALAIPYVLLALTLPEHFEVGREFGFTRSRSEVYALAASPRKYLDVWVHNRVLSRWLGTAPEPFFPGVVALVGAGLALLRWRSWVVLFAAALTVIAMALSFGFAVGLRGHSIPMPYAALYDLVPPIRGIRGVGRFGLLTAIGVPMLAAVGFSAAWQRLAPRLGGWMAPAGFALTALLSLAVFVEARARIGADPAPDMAVYEWLDDQPAGPVADFPAAGLDHGLTGILQTIEYMYGSTRHWDPVMAGYGSYPPEPYLQLQRMFDGGGGQPSMVTAANVELLQDLGVRWVIFHRFPDYDWQTAVAAADRLPQLRRVADLPGGVIYELAPGSRERLQGPVGALTLPATASVGETLSLGLRLSNPYPTVALSRLGLEPEATITWSDGGRRVSRETVKVPVPIGLPPGSTDTSLQVHVPETSGTYTVTVAVEGDLVSGTSGTVTVSPAVVWSEPPVSFERFEWQPAGGVERGQTLSVRVHWQVSAALPADYASTLQIIDERGERLMGVDLFPQNGMPATSRWQPGDGVAVDFSLTVPETLPPGRYRLLTALYAMASSQTRVPLVLPDGTRATEALSDVFTIGP